MEIYIYIEVVCEHFLVQSSENYLLPFHSNCIGHVIHICGVFIGGIPRNTQDTLV